MNMTTTTTPKKKVILTLCRMFPKTHYKAGHTTGFESRLKAGSKIHTIRGNRNGVWDERYKGIASGRKYLCVREWTGRPYNSEQREFATFDKIGLQHIRMTYNPGDAKPQAWVENKPVPVETLAANDGLSVEEFTHWFFHEKDKTEFVGVVIHFTDFRY